MKVGILTSGGDCSGLNAVIRAVGISLLSGNKNIELVGIPEGYGGLICGECYDLDLNDVSSILSQGGTVLGSSRQPFKQMTVPDGDGVTRLDRMIKN